MRAPKPTWHLCLALLALGLIAGMARAGDERSAPRLIVKLDPAISGCLAGAAKRGASIDAQLGVKGFDEIARFHGFRSVRPLRRVDRDAATPALRREREQSRRGHRRTLPPAASRLDLASYASTYVVELSPGADVEAAARELAANRAVVYAEPDRVRNAVLIPNDPYLASTGSWGQTFGDLWGLSRISAREAWDVSRGSGVVIAISDSGVDTAHPDLAANVWVNPGEIADNSVDDDGNGYVDDVHGWNFVSDSADVFDDFGHGTHVAGTAAAVGNNGLGVVGVAYESRIMAVKGLGDDGGGFDSDLADGIVYAVENGAEVINASWGAFGTSQTLTDAMALAHAAGVVVVAAAGNSAADVDGFNFWGGPGPAFLPAADRNTIAVGASDPADALTWFSNFGHRIDLTAPGGGSGGPPAASAAERTVLSLLSSGAVPAITDDGTSLKVGGVYLRQAGTSMAAPHVAGAAAVLLAAHPAYTVEQVRQALRAGADDIGLPGYDARTGYGRLDVAGALAVTPLEARIATPVNRTIVKSSTLPISGSAGGAGFLSYRIESAPLSPANTTEAQPTNWQTLAGPFFSPVSGGLLATLDLASLLDGIHTIRLVVQSSSGKTFEDRIVISLDRLEIDEPVSWSLSRGGTIEFRGRVAVGNFVSYTLQYQTTWERFPTPWGGSDWTTAGVTLTNGGSVLVEDGLLATFDSSVLPGPRRVNFRMTVRTTTTETWVDVVNVVVDPSLKEGWPLRMTPYGGDEGPTQAQPRGHYMPMLVDLDGDGTQEIVASWGNYVHAYRADGTELPGWPVRPPPDYGIIDPIGETGPSVGDLDGDGDLEVVLARDQLLFVYDHQGAPVAGWPRRYTGLWDADCSLADLDGDTHLEIVFGTVSYGIGGQVFPALVHAVRLDGSEIAGFPTSAEPRFGWYGPVSIGDVDGDGSPDLVTTLNDGTGRFDRPRKVRLHAFDAQGRKKLGFPRPVGVHAPWGGPRNENPPLLADLDADGVLDIAIGTSPKLRIAAMRGTGKKIRASYKLPKYKRHGWDSMEPVVAADVTGDGAPELFAATNRYSYGFGSQTLVEQFLVALAPGVKSDGALPGWPVAFPMYAGDQTHGAGAPAIGDIDGDGQRDIVVGSGLCEFFAAGLYGGYRCQGVTAFRPDGSVLPGFPKLTIRMGTSGNATPALGDLDADGTMEVVWIDAYGNLMVWEVPGSGMTSDLPWPMPRQNPAHTSALP